MPRVNELISQILLKSLRHEELTPTEAATLAEWESRSPEHKAFIEMLMDEALLSDKLKAMLQLDQQSAWQKIENALEAEWSERSPVARKTNWYKYAIAASIVLVLGVGAYLLWMPAVDIAPGQDRARLILSNGAVIDLVAAAKGEVAKDSGVIVVKKEEGIVSYEGTEYGSPSTELYNRLVTPRGGQHQLVLPDSTVVFLNAASSIRYPTVFAGRDRRVEITGEVYFEVAANAFKTFIVQVNNGKGKTRATVEALGTHFNIMAYDDEEVILTTLVEGKVKMEAPGASRTKPGKANENNAGTDFSTGNLQGINSIILLPGQHGQLNANNILSLNAADVGQAIAWKNGIISFSNTHIKSIMRQLSRWYNVEIVYEGAIPDKAFTGQIERSVNISRVLEIFKYAGLKFKIEKGKVIVLQ